MKYAGVKHRQEHDKVFWFIIPEELTKTIYIGANVICNTKNGYAHGIVVSIINADDSANKAYIGVIPNMKIVAVKSALQVRDIKIPCQFRRSKPKCELLSKRISEFYDANGFNTLVAVSSRNKLLDGYSAYLVAKMFDCKTIDAYVVNNQWTRIGRRFGKKEVCE